MAGLRLKLLGGFEARLGDGAVLPLPSRKAQALLAYLALSAGRTHPRDKLATLLWGDISQDHARSSLRQALLAIRKALAPVDGALRLEAETVALNSERVDVDVAEFERQTRGGSPEALQAAADAYGGDLLEGLAAQESPFEEWLTAERERLRELALEVLARLLTAQRDQGHTEAAIQTAVRLLALDQLQEPVHRTLMRLHAQLGRRGSALRQYQLCVGILQRELGVEPEPETKQLYQQILRQRQVRHVDAPTSAASRLPVVASATGVQLIGRDAEFARLRAELADVEGGRSRLAMVLGEAGIGKTRLIGAVAHAASELGFQVLLGRSRENEQILPFGPWVEAFRSARVLADAAVLAQLAPGWRAELARLFPEISTGTMAVERADDRRLFESVGQLVEHLATCQPILLVLEDLHWADDMSLRLLSFLAGRIAGQRVAIVGTAREEELVDAPDLRRTLGELARETDVLQLPLGPLSRPETLSLVRTLSRTGTEASELGRLGERVWRGSQGNPFMAVEMLRALHQGAESGDPEGVSLPQKIRDVVARRLERLSTRGQQLAAAAAVIGRDFEFELLEVAAGIPAEDAAAGVEELVRRRVLHGVGERFDFTHDRIRDVAYGQLLGPRRKRLHAAVGQALEEVYSANLEPHYAALGTHYREGDVWEKAQRYLRHAGAQAAARSALQDARVWFEQALGVLEARPESQSTLEQAFEIRLELRPVLYELGEVRAVVERVREAEALAEKLNDDRRRGRVCAVATHIHLMLGELDEARASGTRALAIARSLEDLELRLLSTTFLGQVHHYRGEYEEQVALVAENLAALPADWVYKDFGFGVPVSVFDRTQMVMSLSQLGRFADAAEYEAEVIRLALATHRPYTVGLAHMGGGMLRLLEGDWAKARSLTEHSVAVLRTGNVVPMLSTAIASSAWALAQLGDASEALNRLREGERLLERQEPMMIGLRGWAYHSLGRASLLLGRLDEAQSLANRAMESSPRQSGYAAHALHLLGDIATHPDRFDAEGGEAHYRKALALAELRGMRPLVAHCHLGLGEVHGRTGNREVAQEHLGTAAAMYREMEMSFWLAQAEVVLNR